MCVVCRFLISFDSIIEFEKNSILFHGLIVVITIGGKCAFSSCVGVAAVSVHYIAVVSKLVFMFPLKLLSSRNEHTPVAFFLRQIRSCLYGVFIFCSLGAIFYHKMNLITVVVVTLLSNPIALVVRAIMCSMFEEIDT